MSKLSVPVLWDTITNENIDEWVETLKRCKVERVFLCGLSEFYSSPSSKEKAMGGCKKIMARLKKEGMEVGVWINGFGHGMIDILFNDKKGDYQKFVGEDGVSAEDCFCPSDQRVQRDYLAFVKEIAKIKPDILMIDDDFRLGQRVYALGCFCPNHIEDICKRVGETLTREQLVEKIYSGGANKYRDAYIASMNETFVNFAKMLRRGVDEVYPKMRLGVAMCFNVWDVDGVDGIELAKAFAGDTKPFLRANGAPYWHILGPTWNGMWGDLISTIEYNRYQSVWCKNEGIECMGEGDTYPRPRFIIPSNHLELFDLALTANGELDGMLKYMFDYRHPFGFEKGYDYRHTLNEENRNALAEIFANKKAVGVRVYEEMHKFRDSDFDSSYEGWSRDILHSFFSRAQYPLSHNGISTTYYDCGGAIAVFGENARKIDKSLLLRGVITDSVGAKILTERGIDVGYKNSELKTYKKELFPSGDAIWFDKVATVKMECDEKAEITSVFLPDNSPASYRYENADGQKFFVLGYDSYRTPAYIVCADYIVDYKRQSQLIEAVEWLEGKPLLAKSLRHPYLYITCYRSDEDGGVAVGLFNAYYDDIYDCEISLGETFSSIKFVNCEGELLGDKVKLKGRITPYGFASFELKK